MHAKKTNKTKVLAVVLALVLVIGCAAGATLAWLKVETTPVVNTFTVGNIDINLDETTGEEYKMVPGNDIAKNPKVTVLKDSEDCWLFVEIDESANLEDFITYGIADGWTALAGETGVYYREVATSTTNQEFPVLAGNEVTVLDTVTKEMMDDITAGKEEKPTLTFTAYAVQKANVADAAAAWSVATTGNLPATP